MANPYKVKFYHEQDETGYDCYHRITDETKEDGIDISFSASDMCECPEDATLVRGLFSGWEYIETIELGMKLAQKGYDSLEVEDITKN